MGMVTAFLSSSWAMHEPDLPTNMSFAPYNTDKGSVPTPSKAVQAAIHPIALAESHDDLSALRGEASMYFGGKRAHKAARIAHVLLTLRNYPKSAAPALDRLKNAMNLFFSNKHPHHLAHDSARGGLVSSTGFPPGNPMGDFGNTFYYDHHFHYAYWIHAAALIAEMDLSWGKKKNVIDWVNALVFPDEQPEPHYG